MEQTDFSTFENKQKLPNATAVLVLGIISIITCCCYGLGLILAIVALFIAKKDLAQYRENPQMYSNYNSLNTGRILSIIGIVLSVLYLGYIIWIFSYFGMEALQNPAMMQEKLRQLMPH